MVELLGLLITYPIMTLAGLTILFLCMLHWLNKLFFVGGEK